MEHTKPDGEQHDEVADAYEREADQLAHENERLGSDIDDVRKDWEAKRSDPQVPGAVAPEEDSEDG